MLPDRRNAASLQPLHSQPIFTRDQDEDDHAAKKARKDAEK